MVAATRGPVPKRSDARRRTNDNASVTKTAAARKPRRPAVNRNWHPIAKRWYVALGESGQVVYFEPSDWAQAYFVADTMSRFLQSGRLNANLFAAIDSATARLMVTEGDRRRLRIELEREKDAGVDPDELASVTVLENWQAKFAGGG